MMNWNYDMMNWGGLGWSIGANSIVWLIVGILAIVWLWQQITKK